MDVCAGIGGFSLGLEMAGMTCAGQVEIDEWCSKILARHWPDVPRWRDVKTVCADELPSVDLVCGGYPCQPFSAAGKRISEAERGMVKPTCKPDLDNLVKNIKDCLTSTSFWHDDKQVVSLIADKLYNDGHGPRWEVEITQAGEAKEEI